MNLLISVIFLVTISSIGLTAGAHRLYAHQTFVATGQLKFFIMLAHTMAGVVNKRFNKINNYASLKYFKHSNDSNTQMTQYCFKNII